MNAHALLQIVKLSSLLRSFFFLAPLVLLRELLDATSGVDELHLARIERVRRSADFHFHERIFFAIIQLDVLFRTHRGVDDELRSCRCILEYNRTILWVDVFFHLIELSGVSAS